MTTSCRSAYLHVPFCRHRCGYCNFTLIAGRDDLIPRYLEALERELAGLGTPRAVDTLFLGGGTPTHLPPAALRRLLELVGQWLPLAAGGEYSVEANPRGIEPERIALLRDAGVTRLSLGVQSFDAEKLARLERDHRPEEAAEGVRRAQDAFAEVALDLIFAAPGETVGGWERDLERALELGTRHLSCYGLTFERGTSFWSRRSHGELAQLDEEPERAMYLAAIETLVAAGLEHYEVSNFARPGARCRHNLVYWRGGEYFAFGPGAARHLDGVREVNHRSTTTYIRRVLAGESPVAERERLDPESRARERLVFALRMLEGVERARFQLETGHSLDELAGPALARLVALGMFFDDGDSIRLTRDGLLVSDAIWPELL